MAVAERFKSAKIADLAIRFSALYLLAAPSTPAEVVEEVVARGRTGEAITHASVVQATKARIPPRPEVTRSPPTRIRYERIEQPPPVSYTIRYPRGEAEDPATMRIQTAARDVRRNLSAIADALTDSQIRPIIAAWADDDLERVREGIDAVDRLKALMNATSNVVLFPGSD
jgi:hypothetical protein